MLLVCVVYECMSSVSIASPSSSLSSHTLSEMVQVCQGKGYRSGAFILKNKYI